MQKQQGNCQPDIYKDVVIIGNGPSGICLSYLLAGNWPHYTGEAHPGDEMLSTRLSCQLGASGTGCLSQVLSCREELESLAAGLEGRNAGRPLSLLMDQLQHPCLDAGLDVASLLKWSSPSEHPAHKIIDHVVLGKGPPGGAWNALDPNVLTISLSRWMSLPGLDLRHWASDLDNEEMRQKFLPYFNGNTEIGKNYNSNRVPIGIVAAYYRDYVVRQSLEKYFRCGTVVTSVRPIPEVPDSTREYGWLVQGYECESGQSFEYRCKRVVLATGATDLSNRLGVSGEDTYNWVTHDLKSFQQKLDQIRSTELEIAELQHYERRRAKAKRESVLVVGSGLSAADAIITARQRGLPVLHVYKERPSGQRRSLDKLQWLPPSVYPEYHKVYEMMAGDSRGYPLYRSLADHVVVEFSVGADKYTRTKTRRVTLCSPQGRLVSCRLSFAAVLIGSKPDLSYLQCCGAIGKVADKPVDSRSNQVDVDVFSSRVLRAPRKGLYAVGPLAGDNFVRFILGGAFAVLADILSSNE